MREINFVTVNGVVQYDAKLHVSISYVPRRTSQ